MDDAESVPPSGGGVLMLYLAVSILLLYGAIKGVQWMLGPRGGYGRAPVSATSKLRRGEPWLLLGGILLPTLLFLAGNWWVHRWAVRGFAHATACTGQLATLDRLPDVYGRFGREDIAASLLGYYDLSRLMGSEIGLGADEVTGAINRDKAAYAARYAGLARSKAYPAISDQFASIQRCLENEWPHDVLLNP